jgi:hypothetical protein
MLACAAGFGLGFALLTYAVADYEMNKTGQKMTSEHFNSAGRDVGAGASRVCLRASEMAAALRTQLCP